MAHSKGITGCVNSLQVCHVQVVLNVMLNKAGRNERFRRMFGMKKKVFRSLVLELRLRGSLSNSRYVSVEEKVAIFLRAAVSAGSNRELQERFMRGGATISKYTLVLKFRKHLLICCFVAGILMRSLMP